MQQLLILKDLLTNWENLDFQRLGKRIFRRDDAIKIFDLSDAKPFGALDT
jgi:hypothetical protein